MELDQLFQNSSYVGHGHVPLRPFGLDLLTDAFQLREATSTNLQLAENGIITHASYLKNEYKEKKKCKKYSNNDRLKKQDPIFEDQKPLRDNIKQKNGSKKQNCGSDLFLKQQVKKPRTNGNGGFSAMQAYPKNELNKVIRQS